MGCSSSVQDVPHGKQNRDRVDIAIKSSIIIQKWFRRYQARLETRRRCTWRIFECIEYAAEQDQINLYNFFNEMVEKVNTGQDPNKITEVLMTDRNGVTNGNEICRKNRMLVNIESTSVEDDYRGPHVEMPLELLTVRSVVEHVRAGKLLHAKYVKLILWESLNKMKMLPNILSANTKISHGVTICGDIHGKLDDLLMIFHKNGLPSTDNPYIFNGDFVDRGPRSIEVLMVLCCFFILYPNEVYLNRGNHEDHIMNSRYGFIKEISTKYEAHDAAHIKELCKYLFSWLPLGTIVDNKVLVTHGGISDKTDLNILKKVKRNLFTSILKPSHIVLVTVVPADVSAIAEWEQVLDFLWSDPQDDLGRTFNKTRGGGCLFGPDVTKFVLQKHGLDLLIRSHECKYEGFEYTHNSQVLTIFSCSNYYATGSNYGAYVKLGSDLKPFLVQFSVTRAARTLNLQQKVGVNETSALRELRELFFCNREDLLNAFKLYDSEGSGLIKEKEWVECVVKVVRLKLPWRMLRHKFVKSNDNGDVYYMTCLEGYAFSSSLPQQLLSVSEALYRNRNSLETVFRLIDKDCSGIITIDEFREACDVLNKHSKVKVSKDDMDTLARTLDFNKDGMIDFNEFLEAFRLVSLSFGRGTGNSYHDVRTPTASSESIRDHEELNKV